MTKLLLNKRLYYNYYYIILLLHYYNIFKDLIKDYSVVINFMVVLALPQKQYDNYNTLN